MIKYISTYLILLMCFSTQKENTSKKSNVYNQRVIPEDTMISYNIEGISTEGTGVKARYINGIISKGTIYIFSGTGQKIITYHFENNRINVVEKVYYYLVEMENVKSNKELKLDKEQSYYIDYNGKIIGKPIKDRIDIFQEFKNVVPFELN